MRITNPYDISFNAAKMCFNRFCIDEDAAFEFSRVWYLEHFVHLEEDLKGRGYPMSTTLAYKKFYWSVL